LKILIYEQYSSYFEFGRPESAEFREKKCSEFVNTVLILTRRRRGASASASIPIA
jgi:hypothetical protein